MRIDAGSMAIRHVAGYIQSGKKTLAARLA
jgi:hypothetical protein